jgi:transcription elongation factor GreA
MQLVLITAVGRERSMAELDALRAERRSVVERVRCALEWGGLAADNGEYADARSELEFIERRIRVIEARLRAAQVMEPEPDGSVDIGETVRVRELETGRLAEYRIVGTGEGNPADGDISHESPVGAALIGRCADEVVEVRLPSGVVRLEVIEVCDGQPAVEAITAEDGAPTRHRHDGTRGSLSVDPVE